MKSPNEIKQFAKKKYPKFLSSFLADEDFFPKIVKSDKGLKLSFTKRLEAQKKLIDSSKEKTGFGYVIKFKTTNRRAEGEQEILDKIYFQEQTDYLKFIKKESDFEIFRAKTSIILDEFPQLKNWIIKNSFKITAKTNNWVELLKVCKYFLSEHIKNKFYIRELPIKVHTKFIENNKTILNSLFSELLPKNLINNEYTGKIENHSFEKRYFLKYDKSLIRFRILDKKLFINNTISDISLLPEEFENLNFNCEKIFIAENKMNILTFPQIENSIIIFGNGKGIKQLKNAHWIFKKQIYYWGDIDVHGFEILNQLRSYKSNAKISSLMMDFETLERFEEDLDKGENSKIETLPDITKTEQKIYKYVKDNNLRLEQEKISQEFVAERISTTHNNVYKK